MKTIDLKKLKVRDLKKILNDWDETCDGCLEKGDFIKRIEELKPKHIREELWCKILEIERQLKVDDSYQFSMFSKPMNLLIYTMNVV